MYTRTWGILQELGILLGVCLTVKNYWWFLTGNDGVGFLILIRTPIGWACQEFYKGNHSVMYGRCS